MNKALTMNWNLVEQNFANYCMDLFDEKPVKLSDYGINFEVKMPGVSINLVKIMHYLTNIWISILRSIFVKVNHYILHKFDDIRLVYT